MPLSFRRETLHFVRPILAEKLLSNSHGSAGPVTERVGSWRFNVAGAVNVTLLSASWRGDGGVDAPAAALRHGTPVVCARHPRRMGCRWMAVSEPCHLRTAESKADLWVAFIVCTPGIYGDLRPDKTWVGGGRSPCWCCWLLTLGEAVARLRAPQALLYSAGGLGVRGDAVVAVDCLAVQ